jgi:antitoxin (DNA-binding transcriptional repressor) of toxin-antitoxin stability system
MATVVNMRDAKSNLSRLVTRAASGEEILIAKMEEITPIFALELGGPVRDATGLKGRYDLAHAWYRENRPNSRPAWTQWVKPLRPAKEVRLSSRLCRINSGSSWK